VVSRPPWMGSSGACYRGAPANVGIPAPCAAAAVIAPAALDPAPPSALPRPKEPTPVSSRRGHGCCSGTPGHVSVCVGAPRRRVTDVAPTAQLGVGQQAPDAAQVPAADHPAVGGVAVVPGPHPPRRAQRGGAFVGPHGRRCPPPHLRRSGEEVGEATAPCRRRRAGCSATRAGTAALHPRPSRSGAAGAAEDWID